MQHLWHPASSGERGGKHVCSHHISLSCDIIGRLHTQLPDLALCARPQLGRNRRLDSFFVRDLNEEPDGWALADRSFDAALCCVSVQYLQQV